MNKTMYDNLNIDLRASIPDYKSSLVINKGLTINFIKPIPNAWCRFWTKFFTGMVWEEYGR